MTKEDLVLILQVLTEAKETREIKKLKDKELIESRGNGRNTKYLLK